MFYKNSINQRETKEIIVTLDDFDKNISENYTNDIQKPSIYYNFKIENGCLEDGYGVQDMTVRIEEDGPVNEVVKKNLTSTEIEKIWSFMWFNYSTNQIDANMIYLDEEHQIVLFYDSDFNGHVNYTGIKFNAMPNLFFYRSSSNNVIIFSSSEDDVSVLHSNCVLKKYSSVPKMSSICVHENCFYAIKAESDATLLYSQNVDVENFNSVVFNEYVFSGGEGGRLQKLFSLNDYVYLFRDNGIVKIYPFAGDKDLSITHIYYSSFYIIPETIQRCGDVILFLTTEGLFSFDGSKVKPINADIFKQLDMLNFQTFTSAVHAGKYFLACKLKFNDEDKVFCESSQSGYKNNIVIAYDVKNNTTEIIRGIDVRGFTVFESEKVNKLTCNFYNDNKNRIGEFTQDGKIFDIVAPKKWESDWSDFGYIGKKKILRNVQLISKGNCKLKIESENHFKMFDIVASENAQKININMKGKRFKISFIAESSGQKIIKPEFKVEVLL